MAFTPRARRGHEAEAKVGGDVLGARPSAPLSHPLLVKHREYVATLGGDRDLSRAPQSLLRPNRTNSKPHQVVFLGDGAAWIWRMAELLFPDALQILDFFLCLGIPLGGGPPRLPPGRRPATVVGRDPARYPQAIPVV